MDNQTPASIGDISARVRARADSRNPVFATRSGQMIALADPQPDQISAEDVAYHLSRVNRFAGGVDYNVADHSLRVEAVMEGLGGNAVLRLYALLHDAHEMVYGDTPAPAKQAIICALHTHLHDSRAEAAFTSAAAALDRAIFVRFGLLPTMPPSFAELVHQADRTLLATEKRDLNAPWVAQDWGPLPRPLADRIVPRSPEESRALFLQRITDLEGPARAELDARARWEGGGSL